MPLLYPRIGVTVKSGLSNKNEVVSEIIRILQSTGADVLLDHERCSDTKAVHECACFTCESEIDLLTVIGGDGTILRSIRELTECRIPILSVNRGTVGFLAEVDFEEAEKLIPQLLCGEGVLDRRSMISVEAKRNGETFFSGHALNEAVIAQGHIARIVDLATTLNGEQITSYHADGLIIATPTGSTAYSLASGGPIVHPSLKAIILTPINPYSFSQKPIVMSAPDTHIEVQVESKPGKYHDAEVILTLDGQISHPLRHGDCVHIHPAEACATFLRRKEETFFHTLRRKLHWGDTPGNGT